MPIRFRCSFCNRLLGIATRKAGTATTCPHCGCPITVPAPQDDGRTEAAGLEEIDALLGNSNTEAVAAPQAVAATAPPKPLPRPKARQTPKPPPLPNPEPAAPRSEDRPLFEGDVDAILGATPAPPEPERAKPTPVSGKDAMSLDAPVGHIVLSPQKATFLMMLVVVLMALSFAAGFLLKG